ncbi:MAG: HAD family hydrolase [Synechococcaceae bacterium WBB_3_034]|nr:HAD family hydrolase [Synechococcaceae bacterium WBB_3_034]
MGDSTETALLRAALAAGLSPAEVQRQQPRLHEVPFDSQRRCMSVVVQSGDGPLVITKGAPNDLLRRCSHIAAGEHPISLDAQTRDSLQSQADRLACRGLRVLAVAVRQHCDGWQSLDNGQLESALEFVGLLALMDPPRAEVPAAIAACREAGIKVTMVTGDSGLTAEAIARQIGLLDPRESPPGNPVADRCAMAGRWWPTSAVF